MNSALPDHAVKMHGFGLSCRKYRKYAANLASPCEMGKTARNTVHTHENAKCSFRAGQMLPSNAKFLQNAVNSVTFGGPKESADRAKP